MKHLYLLAAALVATSILGGCIDNDKPGNYPPSMSLERDSMPDNVEKAEQEAQKN